MGSTGPSDPTIHYEIVYFVAILIQSLFEMLTILVGKKILLNCGSIKSVVCSCDHSVTNLVVHVPATNLKQAFATRLPGRGRIRRSEEVIHPKFDSFDKQRFLRRIIIIQSGRLSLTALAIVRMLQDS